MVLKTVSPVCDYQYGVDGIFTLKTVFRFTLLGATERVFAVKKDTFDAMVNYVHVY